MPPAWRERAKALREWGGSPEAAVLWERAAVELEQALQVTGSEVLRLPVAAKLCGVSAAHLADLVRRGKLPNAGRKHAPRVRRGDLPIGNGLPALPQQRSRSRLIGELANRLR